MHKPSADAIWVHSVITYPYAKKAGMVFNDVNEHLADIHNYSSRKNYIQSRERELRKEFEEPLKNLSIYQGKVLMKLINRETGNRIRNEVVDAETGEPVAQEDRVKGYQVEKNSYVQVEDEELDKVALESTHTIDIASLMAASTSTTGTRACARMALIRACRAAGVSSGPLSR